MEAHKGLDFSGSVTPYRQRLHLLSAAKRVKRVGSDAGAVSGPGVILSKTPCPMPSAPPSALARTVEKFERGRIELSCECGVLRSLKSFTARAAGRRGRVPWGVVVRKTPRLAHCHHCALFRPPY